MGQTDRAALGRLVMRAKEYLALVRERDGALTLTTMRFADELRSTKDIDTATQKSHAPARKQLDAAVAVIEALSVEWEPDKHRDRYRSRLRKVVDRKRKGETITAPEAEGAPEPAPDLMEALERTLAELEQKAGAAP
jgi:DNA end-binding protein Ku